MTAATAERATARRVPFQFQFPMAANTKGWQGAIACLDNAGNLTKGAVSTTLKTVGIFEETADNSTGIAGAINGKVARGCYRFANSAAGDLIARTEISSNCYVVDDQTVAKTSGTNTRSVAGVVRDVDSDGVWVEI